MNRVLVVEDSHTCSEALSLNIMALHDFDVVKAYTLDDAKTALEQDGNNFFCATIDINLPDAPRGEAVQFIRENYPHIAIIVMTSELDKGLREDILELDVADYLLKNGQYNLEYCAALVHRIYKNADIEILVVDDSRVARAEMERLLNVQHYNVMQASSGEEAIEILQAHPTIRLAILDCHMEGMTGVETAEIIRETFKKDELAIIGVSNTGGQNMSAMFIKSGANDFLVKPFLPEEFYCRVNQNMDFIETITLHREANELKNLAIGTAAHDIRGPIGVIHSLSQLAGMAKEENRREKYLKTIGETSKNTLELLDSLLNMTVIETGQITIEPESVNLSELVAQRVEFYHHISDKKDITIEADLPELPELRCDPERITQVVDNFVSNAIKYSPMHSEIEINIFEMDGWHRLEIADRGCGISEDNQAKLFNAYQRFSETTAGESSTGLGLVICKNFIEAHQGRIGYRDHEGGGSCFYFMLPSPGNHLSV